MAVVIRRATVEDAQAIADFALKLVTQHQQYNERRFARLADAEQMAGFYAGQTSVKDSAVLVAESDEEVVGFAFLQFERKNYADLSESAVRLHDIYVEETARGRGAGKSLLNAATEAAKEFGASKMLLSVAVQNENARRIFENAGYQTTMLEMMLDLNL